MSISVGSVSVDIVPDTKNFRRDLNAKLKDLSVDVRANLKDKEFKAQLDAATRDRTVGVRVDDKGSIKQMQGRTRALVTTLALLAPAAAPLTAVAIGGAVALTGLGAAGILAVKGISAEMKAGTPLGLQYTTQVGLLKAELADLEHTAANGVLTGFTDATAVATSSLPALRTQVDYLARSIGSDLAPVTHGLLALFTDLYPTTTSIADGIHHLAVDFEGWATGPGGRSFAAYLAQTLPQVADTLGSLATAGAHVVQALLPLGGPVLAAISGTSSVIAKLPVHVIEALYLAFLGYKVVALASAANTAYTRTLRTLGITAATTAAEVDALTAAQKRAQLLGPVGLGAAIGGASALKTLPLFGVGAMSDELPQVGQLQAKNFYAEHPNSDPKGQKGKAFFDFTKQAQTDPAAAAQLKAYGDENYKAKTASDALNGSVKSTTTSIQTQATVIAAWATKMDDAFNKAAGLKGAEIGVHQALADANTSLKENGRTLDLNTQKGRDNRTALLNLATAVHTKVDADVAAHTSQDKLNADLTTGRNELIHMAEKFGLSRQAAIKYANSLLGIPKHITTTLDLQFKAIDTSKLSSQGKAKAKEIADNRNPTATGGLMTHNGVIRRSTGGPVWGAGTATSDSIPALLSNGEFVLKASAVKAIGAPLLQRLNTYAPRAMASAWKSTQAGGVAGGQPQVVQHITTMPGQDNGAIAQVIASQLSIVLGR